MGDNSNSNEQSRPYQPEKVSLGPAYFGQSQVQDYESFKYMFVNYRLPYRISRFQELVQSMIPNKIRQWYAQQSINCSSSSDEDLASMMAIDGLFLLQILREMSPRTDPNSRVSDYINPGCDVARFFRPLLQPLAVKIDIMKLKNQIPIFVLQTILDWEASTYQEMMLEWKQVTGQVSSFLGITRDEIIPNQIRQEQIRLDPTIQSKIVEDLSFQLAEDRDQGLNSILRRAWFSLSPFPDGSHVFTGVALKKETHLLGYVYENIIGSSRKSKNMKKGDVTLPAAVELTGKRRVKFAAQKGLLKEIRFDSRTNTFYLPRIEMDERADTVMRNLLLFEATVCTGKMKPIRCYVQLMCQLIKQQEDVEVLKESGIICSHFGTDEELAGVWVKIGEGLEKGEYEPIDSAIADIAVYTRKHRLMYTEFKKTYFSNPWVAVSLVGACILFVLTVLQTLFSWQQIH